MDTASIKALHDKGEMPNIIYYQLNGQSAWENLREQHDEFNQRLAMQNQEEIESKLANLINNAIADLLNGFN